MHCKISKIQNVNTCTHTLSFCLTCPFLHLVRYVPNVANRSVWEQCIILRTNDRPTDWPTEPPTDLAFCKISNGHISATGHPIYFMSGSRVGFSRSADRMDLLPVGPNPRWRLGKFRMTIYLGWVIRSTFMNYRAAWRNSLQEKIMREE